MKYWYTKKELRKKSRNLHDYLHKANNDKKEIYEHSLVFWDMLIGYFDMRFEDIERKIDKLNKKKKKIKEVGTYG